MTDSWKPVASSHPDNHSEIHRQRLARERLSTPQRLLQPQRPPQIPVATPVLGPVLDLKQAAALLHCHPKTLRLMAQANKVPARRVGKLWRFSERRLREWLEAS